MPTNVIIIGKDESAGFMLNNRLLVDKGERVEKVEKVEKVDKVYRVMVSG